MAGYMYRGSEFDAHKPFTTPEPPSEPKPAPIVTGEKCGTRAGYRAHHAAKEPACDDCRAANTAYTVDWSRRKFNREIRTGFNIEKCGTLAGYSAHRRHAVPMCDACRAACSEYHKERRAARLASAA